MKIKKCANCGMNEFKIVSDTTVSVACTSCGQIYPIAVLKRLPDDLIATQKMKLTVQNNLLEIMHAT